MDRKLYKIASEKNVHGYGLATESEINHYVSVLNKNKRRNTYQVYEVIDKETIDIYYALTEDKPGAFVPYEEFKYY